MVAAYSGKPWDKVYTCQVIESIGSKMDMLVLKNDSMEDINPSFYEGSMEDVFLNVALENNIEHIMLKHAMGKEFYLYNQELVTVLKEIFGIE